MRKYIKPLIILFLFFGSLFVSTRGIQNNDTANLKEKISNYTTIIEVDDEGDGNFTSIQEAIFNSIPGDIIRVYSGTYNESINIFINNITIEGVDHELGEGGDEKFLY